MAGDESNDGVADDGASVACPYCGAPNDIGLDPSGGSTQDYVEDCQVCCQPWRVRVRWRRDGHAEVRVDVEDSAG